MRQTIAISLLFLVVGCATHYAENTAAKDIDRFVKTTLREIPDLPSVGVAAVTSDRIVYLNNPDTAYYIGSTTKSYTGLACAILASRGVIDLDAPVSKYLRTNLNVTLRAFLTHTSGVSNGGIVYRTAYTGEHTHDQLVELLDQSKPIKPGFSYDNLGYVVASLVIEQVTGKPWQQELDELVFKPLGMLHTTAYMSVAKRWKTMATPYERNRAGDIVPLGFEKVDETMHAAGGIVTTPADLARWLQANLSKGRIDGKQIIPAVAFEQAQKLQVPATVDRGDFKGTGYAFGWFQADFHGEHALFHGGGYQGWHSQFSMLPERNIAVGVMTNINVTPAVAADLIASYIYDQLLGTPDVDAVYAERLTQYKARAAKVRADGIDEVRRIEARPWTLQHRNEAYVGRYENPKYGTLVIEQRGGKLYASIGRLTSVMEAYTKPESVRVELTPGSGEPIFFQWGTGDKPDALVWDEDTFTRVR